MQADRGRDERLPKEDWGRSCCDGRSQWLLCVRAVDVGSMLFKNALCTIIRIISNYSLEGAGTDVHTCKLVIAGRLFAAMQPQG